MGSSSIDWELAAAMHKSGDTNRLRAPQFREPSRRSSKLPNEFVRKLTGFSDSALDIILRYGFENVDETGAVPIAFKGVSKRPTAAIGYEKPGVVINRGGFVVVSGVISRGDLNEVGLGESSAIRRVDSEPVLDSHNSANRFNVALGRSPRGAKEHELAGELLDGSVLELSRVTEVNGNAIEPDADKWEIDGHLNLWDEPSHGPLGYTRFDTRGGEPEPYDRSYW